LNVTVIYLGELRWITFYIVELITLPLRWLITLDSFPAHRLHVQTFTVGARLPTLGVVTWFPIPHTDLQLVSRWMDSHYTLGPTRITHGLHCHTVWFGCFIDIIY